MHGVEGVVVGNVMKYGDYYIITATIFDANTASILYTGTLKVKSVNDLADNIDQLALKLCPARSGNISGQSSQFLVPGYRKSVPLLGLLVPGIPQYQAGDPAWGTIYLIAGIAGAGLFTYSEIEFGAAYNNYISADNTSDADNYYSQESLYRTMVIAGAGLWAASAII